jgi:hypothetical protein
MADIKVSGGTKVKTLKAEIKKNWNCTLRVYKGSNFADDDATLASIRQGDAKGGDLKVIGSLKVGNFEKKMLELFGVKVQVANSDNSKLSDNNDTLTEAGRK